MPYLFTSESVSEGHPDKIADQISDAILDAILEQDPSSRVACETLVTTGLVVLAGEITTKAKIDHQEIVRDTIRHIGYNSEGYMFNAESCSILSALHSQSPDIARGVDRESEEEQGAGDQGMMFGYACNETEEYFPMALAFSHRLVQELASIRKNEPALMPYLRPDAKAQVTIEYYDDGTPARVHTIVVSTQHDDFIAANDERSQDAADEQMLTKIREDIIKHLVPRVIPENLLIDTTYHINPTGKFVIGGPHGDAGLTGRKIIVDTYGGKGAHGGGAFSGKDPSKVDRSAAYASRHIAKNLVAAGISDEILVQLAYAIGVKEPVSINVNTYGRAKVNLSDQAIADLVAKNFSFTPAAIIKRLQLTNPIFRPTAAYGHMGRSYETRELTSRGGERVGFFTWEQLELVPQLEQIFAPYKK